MKKLPKTYVCKMTIFMEILRIIKVYINDANIMHIYTYMIVKFSMEKWRRKLPIRPRKTCICHHERDAILDIGYNTLDSSLYNLWRGWKISTLHAMLCQFEMT